jgi:GT2 family glycosyltransferase
MRSVPISVVIPTYRRGTVLLETIEYLRALPVTADEVLVVDQTESHDHAVEARLRSLDEARHIRWLRLPTPSITGAMNHGLQEARAGVALFVDDDIVPGERLIEAHHMAHATGTARIVAGQVLQPGEAPTSPAPDFRFTCNTGCWIDELMGGNFSVDRAMALAIGGFDENFVRVAYRFEAEFCARASAHGYRVLFEPAASIRHLRAGAGGTRSFGHHLTTARPSHAVGAYYYLLAAHGVKGRARKMVSRFLRSVRTRHHLHSPWWIPATLVAELLGFFWAVRLRLAGPRLIRHAGTKAT